MRKVLLVDDEAPARALLQMKVDWASIGCQVVAEAKNGKEALALFHEKKPDLIITDIQMPVMNGLQLIESVREENRHQPIIILSCHESFEFARKAIKLGVQEYLIKDAFDTEELYGIINEMFDDENLSGPVTAPAVQSVSDREKSLATHRLIKSRLNDDEMANLIRTKDLAISEGKKILMYIDIEILDQDPSDPKRGQFSPTDLELIQSLIRNALKTNGSGEVCHDTNATFLVLCNHNPGHSDVTDRREAITLANQFRTVLNGQFKVQTTIGVSRTFNGLDKLPEAYQDSQHAANRKIISGYDRTYLSDSISAAEEDHFIKILNVKLERISANLSTGDYGTVKKDLSDIYLQNLKGFMQYNYLKHANWTLLSLLIEHCSANGLVYSEVLQGRSPWEGIMALKTVESMHQWFEGAISRIAGSLKEDSPEEEPYSYHVTNCIQYIQDHYSENIGVNDLADRLDINHAYLSRIFKKETGTGLKDYINHIRVETAKDLIQNTNKKMYEIAELTGFNSTQRFFSTFKKVTGQAPGDYKKQ